MSTIENYPSIRPSMLLDFANSGRVHPLIQCVRASTATCYGPDGRLRVVGNNMPRITWNPATRRCEGLLVEESRTNISTVSDNLLAPEWNGLLGVAATVSPLVPAPDGSSSAVLVTQTKASTSHRLRRVAGVTFAADTTYCLSVYLKSAGRRFVGVWCFSARFTENKCAVFDLQLGVVKDVIGTGTKAAIVPCGDGWYRCTVRTPAVTIAGVSGFDPCVLYSDDGTNQVYNADNETDGVYVWGVQLEAGSFETSHISAGATAVTRAADLVSLNTALSLRRGAVIAEIIAPDIDAYWPHVFGLWGDNVVNNSHRMMFNAVGSASLRVRFYTEANAITLSTAVPGSLTKMGMSYTPGSTLAACNGTVGTSAISFSAPDAKGVLGIGCQYAGAAAFLNSTIQRIALFERDLSAAQLQRLTLL